MRCNKIFFALASLILSAVSCIGQQRIILNNAESIKLPNRSEKITQEQALAHVHEKFNNDKAALYSTSIKNNSVNYKIDNIIVYLYPHDKIYSLKEGHLLAYKKGFDELYRHDTTYRSYVSNANNNSVLITYNTINNIAYYHFYCYNAADTRGLGGELQFKLADTSKAMSILHDLLNSIEFKD